MGKITEDDRHFRYQSRATYAPVAGVLMALAFIALAIFKSRGLIEFFMFSFFAGASSWVAALFFEIVDFELNATNDSATLTRISLRGFKPTTERVVFQLSRLNCVWMEFLIQYNYRLNLRFGNEWLPLTIAYPQKPEVKKIEARLRLWLDARKLHVTTGEGPLPNTHSIQ
jgi:hypothetical protein